MLLRLSQDEEAIRRAVWEKNLRVVDGHNQEAALGMHSYELAMNHLGDMVSPDGGSGLARRSPTCCPFAQTSEEVLEKMTGLLPPRADRRNATAALNSSVQKLPRSLDYRKKGAVTAVKDQVRRFYDNGDQRPIHRGRK